MLGSTLTTVVVFVPILLIQDEVGQLFRDIAIALSVSVFLSMLVAITVVPGTLEPPFAHEMRCAACRLLNPPTCRRPAVLSGSTSTYTHRSSA